ncbi:MAG: hypothetical protein WC498_04190 [Candidatus Saccharimonadales bacterium]
MEAKTAIATVGLIGLVLPAASCSGSEQAPHPAHSVTESSSSRSLELSPYATSILSSAALQNMPDASPAPLRPPSETPSPPTMLPSLRHETAILPNQTATQHPSKTVDIPVSAPEKIQRYKAKKYLNTVLKPVMKRENIPIINPVNTSESNPVNTPQQFIIKVDDACAAQFLVNTDPTAANVYNISVSVFGDRKTVSDGNKYGPNVPGKTGHAEGPFLEEGQDFPANAPTTAIRYVRRAGYLVCHKLKPIMQVDSAAAPYIPPNAEQK